MPLKVSAEYTTTIVGDPEVDTTEGMLGEAIYRSVGSLVPKTEDRVDLLGYFVDALREEPVNPNELDSFAWEAMDMMLIFLRDDGTSPVVAEHREHFDAIIEAARQFNCERKARWDALKRRDAARVSGNGTTRTPQEADSVGEARG